MSEYERGKRDFAAACERGEADGWLSQFAPGWVADARASIARDLDALHAPLGSRRAAESYNHGIDAALRLVRGEQA